MATHIRVVSFNHFPPTHSQTEVVVFVFTPAPEKFWKSEPVGIYMLLNTFKMSVTQNSNLSSCAAATAFKAIVH